MFDLSKFSLKGKTAIVTGASRGIGKAIALGFAKAGARVALTSRKMNELEVNAAEIKSFGGEGFPVQAHLGKMDEINRMVNTVMDKFGRIDILVNNAGTNPGMGTVLDVVERIWETIMNVNLKGVYFCSQAVAKVMKKMYSIMENPMTACGCSECIVILLLRSKRCDGSQSRRYQHDSRWHDI